MSLVRTQRGKPHLNKLRVTSLVALLCVSAAHAYTLTPMEASSHVGERATVCGLVASSRFAVRSRGNPTFLNLERPYPNQIFTVLIWGSDRQKFGMPEAKYLGKQICVTGDIRFYHGTPEIIATQPTQISGQDK